MAYESRKGVPVKGVRWFLRPELIRRVKEAAAREGKCQSEIVEAVIAAHPLTRASRRRATAVS